LFILYDYLIIFELLILYLVTYKSDGVRGPKTADGSKPEVVTSDFGLPTSDFRLPGYLILKIKLKYETIHPF